MRTSWHKPVRRLVLGLLAALLAAGMMGTPAREARAQEEWEVGLIVGLREGTCIREGPGLQYRAHTRVPENEWAVKVIGGPRQADGLTWYDTSRREAGDPSGGTGWVASSQSDRCPIPTPGQPAEGWQRFRDWWGRQGVWVQWTLALVTLAALTMLWRRLAFSLWVLARLVILGAVLYWLADVTRELWEPYWHGLLGSSAPDLAILLALLPTIAWIVPRLMSTGGGRRR